MAIRLGSAARHRSRSAARLSVLAALGTIVGRTFRSTRSSADRPSRATAEKRTVCTLRVRDRPGLHGSWPIPRVRSIGKSQSSLLTTIRSAKHHRGLTRRCSGLATLAAELLIVRQQRPELGTAKPSALVKLVTLQSSSVAHVAPALGRDPGILRPFQYLQPRTPGHALSLPTFVASEIVWPRLTWS